MPAQRRLSFGSVAELYDAARPSYPGALVDDVIAYAGCEPGDQALEVGAGTGKATAQFAARGLRVLALEPDPAMAAVASTRAATAGEHVRVLVSDFESAELPERRFALLYCAQAWHWVDPRRRYGLAHRVLAPGGAVAVFWNRAEWRRCGLAGELTAAYDRSGATLHDAGPMYPGTPTKLDLGEDWTAQAGELFTVPETRVYRWEHDYTTAEYLALLATHSDHIVLPGGDRERLFAQVAVVIDRHGGSLRLPYATLLCLARVG
jgi:SAM-dependent methyltransferase